MVESEVLEFIDDYKNDEDEEGIYSLSYKKSIGGTGMAEKGGGFNEALENNI